MRSVKIRPNVEPVLALLKHLSLDEMTACCMINVEGFLDKDYLFDLFDLDDKCISTIYKVNHRLDSKFYTSIFGTSKHNLKLAMFCMKRLNDTG